MRIFGREPAVILAFIAVLIKTLAAFGLNVSVDQQAVINAAAAAIVGVIIAFATSDGLSAAVLGLTQAVLALGVGFGLDWNADQQAVVMSLVTVAIAMWTRTQVTAREPAPVKASPPQEV